MVERRVGLIAGVAIVLAVALIVGTVVLNPALADRLTREDDVVEWLQAALFAVAAGFALRSAVQQWQRGASPVFEVLLAAALCGLVVGELDLDRVVVGRKIISTRFLVDPRVWLGWRIVALLVMTVPPAALVIYALWRRRELVVAIRREFADAPGRLLIAGVLIFGLTELFERQLGRIPGLPRYLLEEALELVAAVCLSVALYARVRRARWRRNTERT
jgi:hypothetical protein